MSNIQITKISIYDIGWIVMHHCPECKRTDIYYNQYAKKPDDGDYWLIEMPCHEHYFQSLTEKFPLLPDFHLY